MALESTGQFVLLAGYEIDYQTICIFIFLSLQVFLSIQIIKTYRRRCLALLDVDNPSVIIKRVMRQSKWEVGSAEWNPHSHYAHWCAISVLFF